MKKIFYMASLVFLTKTGLYAQPAGLAGGSTDWRMGGNNAINNLNVIGPWWNPGAPAAPQMWFTTGAAAFQYRMAIFGGGVGPNDGQIAISNNLNPGFVPQARLHMHQNAVGNVFTRYTSNTTGPTATDGFLTGITDPGFAFLTNFEPGQPTAFFTNDGTPAATFERMRINPFSVNGFIGMGNSAGFNALSQLHINTIGANLATAAVGGEVFRTDGPSALDNSWRMSTGAAMTSITQKGRLYVSPVGNAHTGAGNPVDQNFNIEATQADMVFWANGTRALGTTPLLERMRITSENFSGANVTRVGISHDAGPVTDPRAMLHIGQPFNVPGSRGHRPWMDIGTYYSSGGDMMYVGHQQTATSQNNAIVSWGSEPVNFNNPAPPGDRMFFRFMDDPGFGNLASGINGLEIARMVSDGNNGRMSIGNPSAGPIDPGNTLEIISSAASPQPAGLRFRNLNCFSATSPLCNPTSPVYLSVDANGDVILVPGASSGPGCCLGNLCGAAANPLLGDYEIPMNTWNFNFTDPTGTLNDGQNFVRIGGTPPCTVPRAKLDVFRAPTNNTLSTVIGAYLENRDLASSSAFSGIAYGAYGVANNQNSANYGFYGEAMSASNNVGVSGITMDNYFGGSNALSNIGVQGFAQDAFNNIGVVGNAVTGNPLNNSNYAGQFRAQAGANTAFNYGIYSAVGNITPTNGIDNVGVLSYAFNNGNVNNNVGVAGISSNFSGGAPNDIGVYGESTTGGIAGYFAGPVVAFAAPIIFSDSKIKKDIKTVENATELLNKLHPVTYMMRTEEFPHLHLPGEMQYGFIAQEVQQVIPELVSKANKPEFKDKDGKVISKGEELIGVKYEEIIPILTKSLQEQISEVDALKKEIAELKTMIKGSNNDQSTGSNHISNIELTDAKTIVLDQNVPNPFAEQTVITYTLTEDVQKAQMLFYNVDGKLINSIDLNERGKGQLNVFANDLSNGIYTYTLVVDGKIIDSKRMIKNK